MTAQEKKKLLTEVERTEILERLASFGGQRARTAASLGMSPRTLRNKLLTYRAEGHVLTEAPHYRTVWSKSEPEAALAEAQRLSAHWFAQTRLATHVITEALAEGSNEKSRLRLRRGLAELANSEASASAPVAGDSQNMRERPVSNKNEQ